MVLVYNEHGELSIKYAYRVNGRIPRTAPEVPERVIPVT